MDDERAAISGCSEVVSKWGESDGVDGTLVASDGGDVLDDGSGGSEDFSSFALALRGGR